MREAIPPLPSKRDNFNIIIIIIVFQHSGSIITEIHIQVCKRAEIPDATNARTSVI